MTKEERHALIMDMLIQQNSILVTDLSERLQVSSVTIRKDLTELERAKKLYRSHGRAILINPYINNRNVNVKEKLCIDEKRIIGKVAASMITHDDSILIASGTTVHHSAWRNVETQQPLGGWQLCRVDSFQLLLQQAIPRCRRHRPRFRNYHHRYARGKPQPGDDAHSSKNHSSCRLLEIRTPRFQQNCRHGRNRPYYHRY